MVQAEHFDALVLGSGPGGNLLAWHLASSGQRVAVAERRYIGGSCPNGGVQRDRSGDRPRAGGGRGSGCRELRQQPGRLNPEAASPHSTSNRSIKENSSVGTQSIHDRREAPVRLDSHLQQPADQHVCSRNDRRIGGADDRPRSGPVREGRRVPVGESRFLWRDFVLRLSSAPVVSIARFAAARAASVTSSCWPATCASPAGKAPCSATPRLASDWSLAAGRWNGSRRLVGRSRALEIVLSGDDFDADIAERYGWVNRTLDDDGLELVRRSVGPASGLVRP